jgi:hypothetical protein
MTDLIWQGELARIAEIDVLSGWVTPYRSQTGVSPGIQIKGGACYDASFNHR